MPDGSRTGWQAKYVFDVDALLHQAATSLDTALDIHPNLSRYVICFPFDLTGPTARRGRSGLEKFDAWRKEREQAAADMGRTLGIVAWPGYRLRELLLQHDSSGGIRVFFFDESTLTHKWFEHHLQLAKSAAGPRYTPELNIETDLWKWLSAFGRTDTWTHTFRSKLNVCRRAYDQLAAAVRRPTSDALSPAWPKDLQREGESVSAGIKALLEDSECLLMIDAVDVYRTCISQLDKVLGLLATLESGLVADLEANHGPGKVDSPSFRQYMAEYQASFPAANLDDTRATAEALRDLREWIASPECSLAYERVFVLSGVAGSGKTHGICSAADIRLRDGLLSCVAFGHQFGGEPDPWTRLRETLGLPAMLGVDGLLDALDAAGEASGSPLVLFIDAVNETRPIAYWRDRLSAFSKAVRSRPHLRLCITCRTSFAPYCLPADHDLPIVEHRGFSGMEDDACRVFFQHYGLEPPIGPILQPELSNPLYLRLLCTTLHARGLRRLPKGWHGIAPTLRAFLENKEQQFAIEHETSSGASIVKGSLTAIARALADSGGSALSWSMAQRCISNARPQAANLQVLEWLVRADLLVEDAPLATDALDQESAVRPAFERLGDFMIAKALMESCEQTGIVEACQPGDPLHALMKDVDTLERNSGVLAALSILIPEAKAGLELPDLAENALVRERLLKITVGSIPSREPSTFTSASALLICEALASRDLSFDAMDAVLSTSWQSSSVDAIWVHGLLKQRPLAERDAYWCRYLHDRFESRGTVYRLIHAAFGNSVDQLDHEMAERWCTILVWFTAAADRRVKDLATRAVTAVFAAQPEIIPRVLHQLLACDDDEVRERALLSSYGAMITSRHTGVIRQVAETLENAYRSQPEAYDNALIRDHLRCIVGLAREVNALPEGVDPDLTGQPILSSWPLQLPTECQVRLWGDLLRFWPDEFLSDFYKYSMNCLSPWEHGFSRSNMAAWILQRVAREFGYEGSGSERYDQHMLHLYGGGRGKPVWAERIGKKYLWVAMYQLASRLHDHLERERRGWEPMPLTEPLILLEERKLDPTLPPTTVGAESRDKAWWIRSSVDLDSTQSLTDDEWVATKNDIPPLEELLTPVEHGGQPWRILVAYPAWGGRDEEETLGEPYRQVWAHIHSYLIPKSQLVVAYDRLRGRNLFGRWMPEGSSWVYGFAGEYPWAVAYNTEPDEWHSRGGHENQLLGTYIPSWNEIAVEWEYDASIPSNFHISVPARSFFSLKDLWWDGVDGYRLISGRTVFRDPSVTESGPASLIADDDDLLDRLDRLGLRLIWTLLGEKLVLGGRYDDRLPRRTFSQTAILNEDGSVQASKRVFFDDYDQDTGFRHVTTKSG
jgi:hypothetical protein